MNITEIFKSLETVSLGRNCIFFDSIDSTSTYIKNRWQFMKNGYTVVADAQLSGRGRTGKTFFSPKGMGLYMSFVLKEKKYVTDPLFTVRVSYALCRAIDKLTDTDSAGIKWVNDIYAGNKKVAGILCEMVRDGKNAAVIVGIGVNFFVDKASLPQNLVGKVGSLRDITKKKLHRARLCAYILNELEKMYDIKNDDKEFIAKYRSRSIVLGKEINVIKDNTELRAAALDIDSDGALAVRYESGFTEKLTAGEVSIII